MKKLKLFFEKKKINLRNFAEKHDIDIMIVFLNFLIAFIISFCFIAVAGTVVELVIFGYTIQNGKDTLIASFPFAFSIYPRIKKMLGAV